MKKPIRGNEERATQGAGERGSREQASRREVDVHGMKADRELERRVLGVVHDPEDDAHRQSMGGLIP